ncbi:hypothetical protein MKW92_002257 [Papaver armeniacum]|nr:hypothetical protein MKW92_002257 [Papaver armeniacum]
MASNTKKSLSVLFMAFFLMAVVSELANANSFTVYRLPGCSGESQTYSRCGCSNLLYMGGYKWSFTGPGPAATMHNNGNCLGPGGTTFAGSSSQRCNGFQFPWKSVNIRC